MKITYVEIVVHSIEKYFWFHFYKFSFNMPYLAMVFRTMILCRDSVPYNQLSANLKTWISAMSYVGAGMSHSAEILCSGFPFLKL